MGRQNTGLEFISCIFTHAHQLNKHTLLTKFILYYIYYIYITYVILNSYYIIYITFYIIYLYFHTHSSPTEQTDWSTNVPQMKLTRYKKCSIKFNPCICICFGFCSSNYFNLFQNLGRLGRPHYLVDSPETVRLAQNKFKHYLLQRYADIQKAIWIA